MKVHFPSIVLLFSLLFGACEKDLFVKDISDKKVALISPGNNISLKSQTINFIWDEVEDASQYRFRLATPSFDSIRLLLIDSIVSSTTISFTLSPGIYEWQIRGENEGSNTAYTSYKIQIDSTSSLLGFQVVLSSPNDSFYTNVSKPQFSWETIQIATEYNFKIVKGSDFEKGELFTSKVNTTKSSHTLSKALENGFYTWGINAENDNSKTNYSTRFLYFDDQIPNKPQMNTPTNGELKIGGKTTFTWSRSSDSGSPIQDSLIISTDSLFRNGNKYHVVSNGSYSDSLTLGTTYYWKMSTTDRAGNWSGYTTPFKFTIQ